MNKYVNWIRIAAFGFAIYGFFISNNEISYILMSIFLMLTCITDDMSSQSDKIDNLITRFESFTESYEEPQEKN